MGTRVARRARGAGKARRGAPTRFPHRPLRRAPPQHRRHRKARGAPRLWRCRGRRGGPCWRPVDSWARSGRPGDGGTGWAGRVMPGMAQVGRAQWADACHGCAGLLRREEKVFSVRPWSTDGSPCQGQRVRLCAGRGPARWRRVRRACLCPLRQAGVMEGLVSAAAAALSWSIDKSLPPPQPGPESEARVQPRSGAII